MIFHSKKNGRLWFSIQKWKLKKKDLKVPHSWGIWKRSWSIAFWWVSSRILGQVRQVFKWFKWHWIFETHIRHHTTVPWRYRVTLWQFDIAMENSHRNSEVSNWKWWFSMAKVIYRRVSASRTQKTGTKGCKRPGIGTSKPIMKLCYFETSYPLVICHSYGKSPSSMEKLKSFRLGHLQVRNLLVITRGYTIIHIPV